MVAGQWINNDGLPINFGTQKAIPEVGGDYLMYGESREVEAYISLSTTTWGVLGGMPPVPALPSSFTGTTTMIAAGIQSLNTYLPLQATALPAAASSGNGLLLPGTYVWGDMAELECLVTANAGTGGGTGLTGIGLVCKVPGTPTTTFAQVTPNAGTQLMGAVTNAQMAAGNKWTFWPVTANAAMTAFPTTTPPTGGNWGGNFPLVTNAITPLPTYGYISAIASGGTFTGTTAAGLLKLRFRYYLYGNIAQ